MLDPRPGRFYLPTAGNAADFGRELAFGKDLLDSLYRDFLTVRLAFVAWLSEQPGMQRNGLRHWSHDLRLGGLRAID